MPFDLPPLPFEMDALEPYISRETLEYHYGKHHQTYVNNLNTLLNGRPESEKPIEEVIRNAEGAVFNNAAQVWNHTFFWNGLRKGDAEPEGPLADALKRDFGSFQRFKEEMTHAATSQFGSGWAWLIWDESRLKIAKTLNADLPLRHGQKALFTIDVWEHAYYIDYRNARQRYVSELLDHLVNWDFVAENFGEAR